MNKNLNTLITVMRNLKQNGLNRLRRLVETILLVVMLCSACTYGSVSISHAQSAAPSDEFLVFLPVAISNRSIAQPTPTPTPPTPTPPPNEGQLPADLLGTWFSGNQPLNDFYNPSTGEWRSVNGLGQMYVFEANGKYTYSGFLRIENGACRSEVSVYRQGNAQANATTLTLRPTIDKTRTVIICPSPKESIVEGDHAPVSLPFTVGEDKDGHSQLIVREGNSDTNYLRSGMATALLGVWKSATLEPQGFYDTVNDQFNLSSPMGMWFRFNADATYTFGEHNQSAPDAAGCIVEFWIYQTGTLQVNGGQITVTPKHGALRLTNSCNADSVSQIAWLDNTRTYLWLFRDRSTDIKLVMIPLERFVEFIFSRS